MAINVEQNIGHGEASGAHGERAERSQVDDAVPAVPADNLEQEPLVPQEPLLPQEFLPQHQALPDENVAPQQDVIQEPPPQQHAEREEPLRPPPPHHPRVPAGGRMDTRGILTLSAVYKRGQQIGWGANCGVCVSATVRSACKKQLPYGGQRSILLNDDQCRRKLKKWLTLCVECEDREAHLAIDARALPLEDEGELDNTINILRESL